MAGVTLDTGALIALERGDRRMLTRSDFEDLTRLVGCFPAVRVLAI
jgi:hypothetical protein